MPPAPAATLTSTDSPVLLQTGGLPAAVTPGESIPLPPPRTGEAWPLMTALLERRSSRSFRSDELPLQAIADLLWAGFGVNRPGSGGRTAPSAYDVQDIQIWLTLSTGTYRYLAEEHALLVMEAADLRGLTGSQDFVAGAPLNLVYVSDGTRLAGFSVTDREHWPWTHAGCIAQNVSLACAALGLAAVVRSTLDRGALARALDLPETQQVLLAQTVGYPA
ncbi:SagB/ThcOx family dehydrogenase [bacterium]|nr:SagB/ThcOx family dehydrogenase [bacterium]